MQHIALRQATYLESIFISEDISAVRAREIAGTLRRLHAENETIRKSLEASPVAEVTVSHVHPNSEGLYTAEVEGAERLSVGAELFVKPIK